MAANSYSDGVISLVRGSATASGLGTAWSTQAKPGDVIHVRVSDGGSPEEVRNEPVFVESVTDDLSLVLQTTWELPDVVQAEYRLVRGYAWWYGAAPNEILIQFLTELGPMGLVGVSSGVPDPSTGRENEIRVDVSSGIIYQKRSGAWIVIASGFAFDAIGDMTQSPSERTDYDLEAAGFTFLSVTENGFYVKLSAVDGDWSPLISIGGPAGAPALITGSSPTSLAIGIGSKAFTGVDEGRQWVPGMRLRAASLANPSTHWMEGVIASYAGDALNLTVDKLKGSGSRADWQIGLAGEPSDVAGADGTDPGLLYDFSDVNTAGADPGTVRLDNDDWTLATKMYVADLDRSNNDHAAHLVTVGDSTSVSPKGHISLKRTGGGNAQAVFAITGGATAQSGYTEIPVSRVSGATGMIDGVAVSLEFELRGDAGSGANAFTDLADTPATLAGQGGKVVAVKGDASGLEFVAAFQPLDSDLTAIAALTTTSFGRALLELANAAAGRTAFGLASGDSPQFAGIELGHATDTTVTRAAAGVIAVEGVPIYSNIPQNSQSGAYTCVLADAQKHIFHPSADTTARTWTIPANASVAYPIGTAITFINQNAAGVITIAITTDTLRMAESGATGNRSLAANGIATAIKVTSTEWLISGTGLT